MWEETMGFKQRWAIQTVLAFVKNKLFHHALYSITDWYFSFTIVIFCCTCKNSVVTLEHLWEKDVFCIFQDTCVAVSAVSSGISTGSSEPDSWKISLKNNNIRCKIPTLMLSFVTGGAPVVKYFKL